jgi:serine phosphatase RsbU (regulator of sigma subunit)
LTIGFVCRYKILHGQIRAVSLPTQTGQATRGDPRSDTLAVGILDDCEYEEIKLEAQAGEKFAFYIDRIVETMNEQEETLGCERLF